MPTTVVPVGAVRNGRTDPQDTDDWADVESTILVDERFGDHCLAGLSEFSHVEVVFLFHRLAEREDYRQPLRIKPVMRQFVPEAVRQPDWVDSLMKDYFGSRGAT